MKSITPYIILSLVIFSSRIYAAEKADTSTNRIVAWELFNNFSDTNFVEVDTFINQFHIYKPFYKHTISFSYLGNLGTPGISNIFNDRKPFTYFIFNVPFEAYFLKPENTRFYNTLKPVSKVNYTTGDKKSNQEQTFDVQHTRNVNEYFNVGLNYKNISSIGQLANQKTTANNFSMFSSYIKNNVSVHGALNFNKIKLEENGGITNDSVFENSFDDLDLLDVQFGEISTGTARNPDAWTIARNRNMFISTKYDFTLERNNIENDSVSAKNQNMQAALFHLFKYNDNYRAFHDIDSVGVNYYDNIYINRKQTSDSAYFRHISNTLSFNFFNKEGRKFKFDGKIGITNEFLKYNHKIIPDTSVVINDDVILDEYDITVVQKGLNDTLIDRDASKTFTNNSLWFNLNNVIFDSWKWNVDVRYFFTGYENGNFRIKGTFSKNFIKKNALVKFSASINEYQPDYFYQNYESNYFVWHNNFSITRERNFKFKLIMPDINLRAGIVYYKINNMVYHGKDAEPKQYDQPLIIISPYVYKNISFWKINTLNELVFQFADNQNIIPLPQWALYHSLYYNQPLFDQVLFFQVGYDVRINSDFYGYNYMPSLGLFHNQYEKHIGMYPLLDVFLNVKVKKTRFFVKYENLLSLSLFELKRKFYSSIHYPNPSGVIRFGLSWIFLN